MSREKRLLYLKPLPFTQNINGTRLLQLRGKGRMLQISTLSRNETMVCVPEARFPVNKLSRKAILNSGSSAVL